MFPDSQISRRWNSVALDYISNRKYLPIIKCINWERNYFNSEATRLTVTLQKRFRNYLGFKSWTALYSGKFNVSFFLKNSIGDTDNQVTCVISEVPFLPQSYLDNDDLWQIAELTQGNWLNEATPCNILIHIFRRCSYIKRFEITNYGLFPYQWLETYQIQMIANAKPQVEDLAFTEIREFHDELEWGTCELIYFWLKQHSLWIWMGLGMKMIGKYSEWKS